MRTDDRTDRIYVIQTEGKHTNEEINNTSRCPCRDRSTAVSTYGSPLQMAKGVGAGCDAAASGYPYFNLCLHSNVRTRNCFPRFQALARIFPIQLDWLGALSLPFQYARVRTSHLEYRYYSRNEDGFRTHRSVYLRSLAQ